MGVIGATAIAATVTDPRAFKSGRDLAAWIGLVPRQNSTRQAEARQYLEAGRQVSAAIADRRRDRRHPACASASEKHSWLTKLLAKMPAKKVAVALANKTARIAWAIWAKERHIPATSARSCSLKRLGDGSMRQRQRTTTGLRGDDGVMRKGRAVDREAPSGAMGT